MATKVDQRLLRQTKFPPEFTQKVDMQKVNVEVMKKWIARKLSEILGSEDDVVIELCFNLLEGSRFPNIKELQIQLTGFLDKDTAKFCKELWNLCLSAQENAQGVPKELLEAKKLELMQEKAEAEKAAQEAEKHKAFADTRDRNIDDIRRRERGERFDRGRGFSGRGRGRGNFDADGPPRRRSISRSRRSPPRGPPPRREIDTYVPRGSKRYAARGPPRGRSPTRSWSEASVSRSPPRRKRKESPNHSRSRSPPRKQRRIRSRSRDGSAERGGRRRRESPKRRARSPTSSVSRSPSPRPWRDRRRVKSSSLSRSPSPDRRRRRKRSPSAPSADSRDGRRGGKREHRKHRRHSSSSLDVYRSGRRADVVKPRTRRDNPRLSRSPDEADRTRRRSPSRSRSRSRSGSHDRSRSRSRSRSRDRRPDHKRRRSIPRYDPRRRRNTSSPPLDESADPEPELEPKRPRRDASLSSRSRSDVSDINGAGISSDKE